MFLLCSSNIRFIRLLTFAAMMKSADNRGQSDIFDVEQRDATREPLHERAGESQGRFENFAREREEVTSIIN